MGDIEVLRSRRHNRQTALAFSSSVFPLGTPYGQEVLSLRNRSPDCPPNTSTYCVLRIPLTLFDDGVLRVWDPSHRQIQEPNELTNDMITQHPVQRWALRGWNQAAGSQGSRQQCGYFDCDLSFDNVFLGSAKPRQSPSQCLSLPLLFLWLSSCCRYHVYPAITCAVSSGLNARPPIAEGSYSTVKISGPRRRARRGSDCDDVFQEGHPPDRHETVIWNKHCTSKRSLMGKVDRS